MPSLYEPFGLVALEAQLAGTPVAVSDTGGLRELVEPGVTGVRFAPESPAAIAGAVGRLLRESGRRGEMAGTAQQRARDPIQLDGGGSRRPWRPTERPFTDGTS